MSPKTKAPIPTKPAPTLAQKILIEVLTRFEHPIKNSVQAIQELIDQHDMEIIGAERTRVEKLIKDQMEIFLRGQLLPLVILKDQPLASQQVLEGNK